MEKKDIVVVVPVYRSVLSEDEVISLAQCVKVLSGYSIVIVKPESLNVSFILSEYPSLHIETFPDQCFLSLRAYNKLVLDESFYKRFMKYQYMLIYQLDAYVFKDELLHWSNQGYDYIGAPWLPLKRRHLSLWGRNRLRLQYSLYRLINSQLLREDDKYYYYQVGNGGFSLRKISKMIEITHFYEKKISDCLDDNKPFYPEDVFLLLELKSPKYRLRKPRYKEALKFSIEENPAGAYDLNNRELPFGCHAWNHPYYSPFWLPIIKPE